MNELLYRLHFSERLTQWRQKFSADQSAAFNRYGWNYYTRGWYSQWAPIYTNAWANIIGAAGLLYEQAGVDATSIKQPAGHQLTYRESVQHQLVSSLANLETGFIYDTLKRNDWNRHATARELGMHPSTLWRKIKKLNIQLPDKDGRYR